jgi:hypothetical protein
VRRAPTPELLWEKLPYLNSYGKNSSTLTPVEKTPLPEILWEELPYLNKNLWE